jgi:1-deoxy-D-xylulose-5-phosphate reductoisomerase
VTTSVAVVGSTGSIGTQTLEVAASHADRFAVTALAAGSNAERVAEQARATGASLVALADEGAARRAEALLAGTRVEVVAGEAGVAAVAGSGADVVVNGMVGSGGLRPTLAALSAGSRLALANKESLIVGGDLVLAAAGGDPAEGAVSSGRLVPVDSEHAALLQCLRGVGLDEVARLVVTASGGPFRGRTREQLGDVTVADALAHPTWSMGAVITVSSATLANKGLEVIEAHLLFGLSYERVEVVVHPQSVVHGMVELCDGSTLAQLSLPDMRLPIQLALSWPERLEGAAPRMDWTRVGSLEFEPVDADTFPMLRLAYEAGRLGGTAPAAFNAANEEAIAAFLEGRLSFLGITDAVAAVLEWHDPAPAADLDGLLAAESDARRRARELIDGRVASR